MTNIAINRVTNAAVYVNGNSLLGRAEEVDLPKVGYRMGEFKPLGLVGLPEFANGIDKLEAKIKWTSLYPEVLGPAANPFATVQLQVRASIEQYASQGRTAEQPFVCMMTAQFKEYPQVGLRHQEAATTETMLSVFYMKHTIAGADVLEIDILQNIWKSNGVDVLAQFRANLGQ